MTAQSDFRLFDPDTAMRAALDNRPRRGTHRWLVLELLAHHSLTDFELAERAGPRFQQTSLGKRRKELMDIGFVEWMGTERPAPSGSMARVWCITPDGFAYWNKERHRDNR